MIEHRPHPRGERGTKLSVQEIVKKATEGRLDPRVRAWSIEALKLAGWPESKLGQAKAILAKLRAERHYVEDPVDGEFMPSAACTLEGCEGLIFFGEDCDGLLIAFLGAIESVGIEGAVLAHSYSPNQGIVHVLAAVFDGQTWHRCDPSTQQPWGEVHTPTREIVTLIPSGKQVCDSSGWCNLASLGSGAKYMGDRPNGDFVGVGTPVQDGAVGAVGAESRDWPDLDLGLRDDILGWLRGYRDDLRAAWLESQAAEEQLYVFRYGANAKGANLPMLDPEGTEGGWTEKHREYAQALRGIVPVLLGYAEEALASERNVAWDERSGEAVILGKPGDQQVLVEANAIVLKIGGEITNKTPASGAVGLPQGAIIAGAFVVSLVGIVATSLVVYGVTKNVVGLLRERAQERMQKQTIDYVQSLIDKGVPPAEALAAGQALLRDSAEAREAENKRDEQDPLNKFTDMLKVGMYAALGLGALYVGAQLLTSMPRGRSTALARY